MDVIESLVSICSQIFPCFNEAWADVSSFQSAYDVGKGEAEAAMCLLKEVDSRITDKLTALVQRQPQLHSFDCSKVILL